MKKSRFLALLAAAAIAVSPGAQALAAEPSYSQVQQGNLDKILTSIDQQYDRVIEQQNTNTHLEIRLTLEDTGRALAGMFVPLDLSWINNVSLILNADSSAEPLTASAVLSLNETQLAEARLQMDLASSEVLIQLPEFAPGVLSASYDTYMEAGTSDSDQQPLSPEDQAAIFAFEKNLRDNPPEKSVVVSLVDRYLGMILGAWEDDGAEEQPYRVNGIEQTAVAVDGILTENTVMDLTRDLLTTARDDEELKGILAQAAEGTSLEGTLIESYESGIDELLGSLDENPEALEEALGETEAAEAGEEADAAEENPLLFRHRIYVDEEGKAIGNQLFVPENGEEVPAFTVVTATEGEEKNLYAELKADETALVFSGSGTSTDGVLDGSYRLTVDSQPTADIEVHQTSDEETIQNGQFEGTYTITPVIEENSEEANAGLAGSQADLYLMQDGVKGELSLGLTMNGAPLGTLSLLVDASDAVLPMEEELLAERYNVEDDEAMSAYMQTFNPEVFFQNLTAAGMPDGFMDSLFAMMSGEGAGGDEYALEDSGADDYAQEEDDGVLSFGSEAAD